MWKRGLEPTQRKKEERRTRNGPFLLNGPLAENRSCGRVIRYDLPRASYRATRARAICCCRFA